MDEPRVVDVSRSVQAVSDKLFELLKDIPLDDVDCCIGVPGYRHEEPPQEKPDE